MITEENAKFMDYLTLLIDSCRITFEVIRNMRIDENRRDIYCEKLANAYKLLRKPDSYAQLKMARQAINEVREEFGFFPVMSANEFIAKNY